MPLANIFSRPKVWLSIGVVVVLIGLGIWFWWFLSQRTLAPVVLQPQSVTPDNAANTNVNQVLPITAPAGAELSVVTRTFVERYGSFSNQSNQQNIRDVWSMVTPAFQGRFDFSKRQDTAQAYTGIETHVISIKLVSQTASEARLTVKTQRSERKADLKINEYYQDIIVSLVKSGDHWLVDRAEWQ